MSAGKVRTALSPSGALVRSALLSVSDGVVVLRPSGRIIDIDAHLRRRLGIAAAALSKRTLWSLVEPPHRSPLSAAWRTSKGGLAAFDAVPFSLPRGAVMTADLRFTRDDASGAVLCALHDVSAHRRDASSLAEQNREYEELLTRVPFALYKFRRTAQGENRLEYLSPRVAEMFGIDTAPLLSDVDRVVELVHEEDRAAFAQWITDPRWQDEDTSIEVRYGTPGGVRWIRLDASPHHMENGDIVWDGIVQDVTDRRGAEEQLKRQNHDYRFLAEASAKLADCTDEKQVYSVISSMFTSYLPGSLVFVLKTLENGRKSTLMEIGGIRPDILETGRTLLRFDPIGRTFENRDGFYEKYCRPKLRRLAGGLHEASSGVVPKIVAGKIERLLGVSHTYTVGIAEGGAYAGYIDLMTPSELSFEPATVESFMHQCYLALATIAETQRADEEAAWRRFHFENSVDGIVVLDEDRKVIETNHRFADMLGYTVDEMLAKHAWDWDATFPSKKAFLNVWPEIPRTSGIVETQHRRKDGGLIDIEVVWVPMERGSRRRLYCLCRDISARKRSESLLRERDRLLSSSQQIAHIGSWVLDVAADDLRWSDETYRIFGIPPQDPPLSYDRFLAAVHAEDRRMVDEAYTGSIESAAAGYEIEHRIVRPGTGEVRCVVERCVHDWSPDGRLLRSIGIVQDITERKAMVQSIAESERRYRTLFETMAQGVVYHDASGAITAANPAAARILGLTMEELLGRTSMDPRWHAVHEDGRPFPGTEHPAMVALRTGRPVFDALMGVFRPHSNGYGWIIINAVPLFGPDGVVPNEVFATFEDITDRRNAEERLRANEQKLRNIFDATEEGIALNEMVTDDRGEVTDYRILEVNSAFERITGIPHDQAVGRLATDIYGMTPHSIAEFWRNHRGDTDTIKTDLFDPRLPGWMHVSTSVPVNGRFVTSFFDITERVRIEEDLRRTNEQFRSLVQSQTNYLIRTDITGAYTFVNDQFCRAFGYERERLLGTDCRATYLPQDYPAVDEAVGRCLAEPGTAVPVTIHKQHPRHGVAVTEWEFVAITDAQGIPTEIQCVGHDVTERIRAEEAVRESERRFSTLFNESPMAHALLSADGGTVIDVNDAAVRLFGYARSELLGRPADELGLWDDHAARSAAVERLNRDGRVDNMEVSARVNGRRFIPALFSATPIDIGGQRQLLTTIIDISERKRFENELRISEERYRTVANYTYDWEMWVGNDGAIRYISPSCERITGYAAGEFLRDPSLLSTVVHPDDRVEYRTHQEQELRDGSTHALEMRIITRTGDERWIQHLCRPIITQDGRNLGRRVSNRDITERKMDERRLQESEERYRGIVENIHQAYYEADSRAVFTYCNPGLLILSGYGADELYAMSSFRLVCEEDRPRVMEQYRAWKKGSTRQMVSEFRVRTKDGNVFWVEQTTHMEFEPDGTFVRAFNFVKDIRERKNAEEELRRSEERNRTIVATIPDVLFVQDAEGRFLDIHMPDGEALLTPAAAFVGRTMEDLLSQEEIFGAVALRLESPDLSEAATDIASVRRFVSTVVLPKLRSAIAEQAPQLYQYSLTVNGTTAHFEARLAPFDETRVLHIVRNVTEKVAYEQTLRTMNEELENRVLSRTTELTEANRELEAFSYSVSHDLRAPLRAIDSFSAVLEEEYGGTLDDEARRLISVIRGSIRRMDQLVNGLLTLSRIGRDELRLQRVDMNGFFRAEVDAVLPPGSQHRHSVTIAPLPDCRADETLLRQAVGNLLSNAVKYSSASSNPEIFISGTVRGGMAVYTVADNGVGFDPEQGKKLFGIFQRLHTDERFKGVGVGLSIVQRVIQRLGGDITAEGRVDGGASFTFTLPLADDER